MPDYETSLFQAIENVYYTLSKRQQLVADYVLRQPSFVATHAAKEVGEQVEVSETTVLRFCTALSFEGYTSFQKALIDHLLQTKQSSLRNYLEEKKTETGEASSMMTIAKEEANRMIDFAQQMNEEQIERVSRRLHEARHIYIVGYGASHIAAQWLQFTLRLFRQNVTYITCATSDWLQIYRQITEKDAVCIFSFHRYFKEPIQFAKWIEQTVHCPVIAFTDSPVAPIVPYATESIIFHQKKPSTLDLMPSLIVFINALTAKMTTSDATYYEQQQFELEQIQRQFLDERWSHK